MAMEKRTVQIALPSMGEEEWQAVRGPIESGWPTLGGDACAQPRWFAGSRVEGNRVHGRD